MSDEQTIIFEESEKQPELTGFQIHPENINKDGLNDKAWRWREVFIEEVRRKKEGIEKRYLMAQAMVDSVIEQKSVQAFKEIADRMEGKAPQGFGNYDDDGKFKEQNLNVLFGK